MKFYIASSLSNFNQVNTISNYLTSKGWEHTYNWAKDGMVSNETLEQMIDVAVMEEKAVANADIVIIILPAGRGSHVELGMSIAYRKKIYIYCEDDRFFKADENTSALYWHPSVIRETGDINLFLEKIISENLK